MQRYQFKSHDGLTLCGYKSEIPEAQANVFYIHGFFEHAGRYLEESKRINAKGYNFYSFDQRTHGQSEGSPRSFISSIQDYLKDLNLFFDSISHTGRNNFILCHSFGGLVIASYVIENRKLPELTKGIVFSAPFLLPDENTAPFLQKIAGVVGTLLPRLKVVELDPTEISNVKEEVELYQSDPLIYKGKMYAGSAWQMLKQIRNIKDSFSKIDTPLLILHGLNDKVANPKGGQLLYDSCSSPDKKILHLNEQKHEILKDADKENTWSEIFEWINERN